MRGVQSTPNPNPLTPALQRPDRPPHALHQHAHQRPAHRLDQLRTPHHQPTRSHAHLYSRENELDRVAASIFSKNESSTGSSASVFSVNESLTGSSASIFLEERLDRVVRVDLLGGRELNRVVQANPEDPRQPSTINPTHLPPSTSG